MGVFNETEGDNDFASIFPSVAEERRVAQEREQADLLLRLLDEMEEREKSERAERRGHRTEYLRVAANGDVVRDPVDEERRGRIMTVDQLPKESEYEMLFGKPPEEPQLKVETGMRLRDGREFQSLKLDDIKLFSLPASVKFETVFVIGAVIFFLLVLASKLLRIRSDRKRRQMFQRAQEERHEAHLKMQNHHMEQEVERRVRERLSQILVQANNNNLC